ncbi:MAG: hypothetical protein EOO70_00630 [Myxococcaceae bacterium]|nr:MAG: hypothetical protein EOO70_00630 [Myxococcaceae bacterium]
MLREHAVRFRQAIEQAPPGRLGSSLTSFPAGACGDASLLLGSYLQEVGEGEFSYVLGWRARERDGVRDGRESHAWLQQGEILIDITADQFSTESAPIEPVIVTNAPNPLHLSFETEVVHEVAGYQTYITDPYTFSHLQRAYRLVKGRLP